ncbi:NUDIX hydrolase [Tessaracoccus sp. Y36]
MSAGPTERRVKRRRGARVIVLSSPEGAQPQVLLQGDTDPGIPGSRFWQTPGGGIDDGESPPQAAARELYEETGLTVDPEELGRPVATRTVTHGYSDRVLIQHETYYRLHVPRFDPVHAALSEAEAKRRVETRWFPLDALPADVWPAELPLLAAHDGEALDLGEIEESTVPARS